jgi:hypothetical protein
VLLHAASSELIRSSVSRAGRFLSRIPIRAYRSVRLAPGKVSQENYVMGGWRSRPRSIAASCPGF